MTLTDISNKKVLILGASGQIGSSLLSQLLDSNNKISAVRKSDWRNIDNKEINYLSVDLDKLKSKELSNLVLENDYIFHLAGDIKVQCDLKEEKSYLESWLNPLQNILSSLVGTNKKFLFASSCSQYGTEPKLPVNELSKENPLTSYDLSKTFSDYLVHYYRTVYKVNCCSLRFSNIYGPADINSKIDRKIINKILHIIHTTEEISIIEDGNFLRNYLHVFDAASMFLHVANNIEKVPAIVIACSKENYLFKEVILKLVEIYQKKTNKNIVVNYGLKKKFISDIRQFSSQPSSIFSKNFTFKYNLERGFEDLVDKLIQDE